MSWYTPSVKWRMIPKTTRPTPIIIQCLSLDEWSWNFVVYINKLYLMLTEQVVLCLMCIGLNVSGIKIAIFHSWCLICAKDMNTLLVLIIKNSHRKFFGRIEPTFICMSTCPKCTPIIVERIAEIELLHTVQ